MEGFIHIFIYTQRYAVLTWMERTVIYKYLNIMRRFGVKDWTVLEQYKYSPGIADSFIKNSMCVYISCSAALTGLQ